MPPFLKSQTFWLSVFLIAGMQPALPQQCPPNAHPVAVAIPGNLRPLNVFAMTGIEGLPASAFAL